MLIRSWTSRWTAEEGESVTAVTTTTGASKSVISPLKEAAEGRNAMQKNDGGRRRIITPQQDRYVSLMAKRIRNTTPNPN